MILCYRVWWAVAGVLILLGSAISGVMAPANSAVVSSTLTRSTALAVKALVKKPALKSRPAVKPRAPKPKPKPNFKPKPRPAPRAALPRSLEPRSATLVISGPFVRQEVSTTTSTLTIAGVLTWTNRARQEVAGLSELTLDPTLSAVAERRLADMFAAQYFAHDSPSGVTPAAVAAATGYKFINLGENIARGNFESDRALITAWLNSPNHRANILSPQYSEIGLAVGYGKFEGQLTWMAVQNFGRPRSSCPELADGLKQRIETDKKVFGEQQADFNRLQRELNALNLDTPAGVEAYNRQVGEYNIRLAELNRLIARIKAGVAEYNDQVKRLNVCLNESAG